MKTKGILLIVGFVALLVIVYFFVIKKQQTAQTGGSIYAQIPGATQGSGAGTYATAPAALVDAAKALPAGSGTSWIDKLVISALQNSNTTSGFDGHY